MSCFTFVVPSWAHDARTVKEMLGATSDNVSLLKSAKQKTSSESGVCAYVPGAKFEDNGVSQSSGGSVSISLRHTVEVGADLVQYFALIQQAYLYGLVE